MKIDELDKYIGLYVSFDYAITPPPWATKEMNNSNHIEGVLERNNGRLSHYRIGECALRDDLVGLICNFEVRENVYN